MEDFNTFHNFLFKFGEEVDVCLILKNILNKNIELRTYDLIIFFLE